MEQDKRAGEQAASITPADLAAAFDEQQAARIRRIGKKLFGVANCLITFGLPPAKSDKERSMASIEAQFSDALPLSGIPEFVSDAKSDRFLGNNRYVIGAPYIRCYASYPVKSADEEVVANIRLIDYSPRTFGEEERRLLSDLAVLVERELHLITVSATRLELLKKNWSLRRDSMIDPVAGTWNRTAIERLLKQEIDQCRADDKPLSVVMADLDEFKKVNEAYGRTAGDVLLVKIVSRLRSCIRPHDTLGRYEGGKFMIILPGACSVVAKLVAERLQNAIKTNPEKIGEKSVSVTISSGSASTDRFPASDSDDLMSRSLGALAAAQKLGHNSIVQATPSGA